MSVGYADEDDGGLDALNVDDAAAAVGRAGQLPVDAVSGGAGPDVNASDISLEAEPDPTAVDPLAQQGAPGADGPHTPVAAGSTPAPATTDANGFPLVPQFPELGPPPPPPAPTGDPQKDVAANLQWQRQLVAHHGELTKRQTALAEHAAAVGALKGKKEAEVAAVEAREKAAEVKQAAEDRRARQMEINQAIAARVAAAKDVEGLTWDKSRPHTGAEITAIIISGIGAAIQNMGMAQLGHAPNAQNEALKGINARMEREFEAKKMRLKAAGDAVLMARYEAKDADEAHRAAMNDINADMAAKYKLIAKQAEDAVKQQGGTAEQAKGNAITVAALQAAAKQEGEIANREEGHEVARKTAAGNLALARANLGERRTEHRDTLDERQREFDLRRSEAKDKADEKKQKGLEDKAVRDGAGIVRGYAANTRNVKQIQDRLVQYDDAIKSAEDLLAYRREHNVVGRLPTGDAYDRAVLAVAATTQANASDSTTAHEAGTLKKLGMVDEGAIEKTIEHLKERQAKFMKQLTPLEPGEDKASSRVSLPPQGEPARGGGGAKGVDEAKIDRAFKVMSDPKQPPEERKGAKNFLISQGKL